MNKSSCEPKWSSPWSQTQKSSLFCEKHLQPGFSWLSTLTGLVFYFVLASPCRAAHSLAEWGAGCHLLGEDEWDLAPPPRLLAAGGNRDVSLTAVARAMTPACLFSYQPAAAQLNKSASQPEPSKQPSVSALSWCSNWVSSCCSLYYGNLGHVAFT